MNKRLLSSSTKLFSAEAATSTLPLVSAIVRDLAPLWQSVQAAQGRIEKLMENRRGSSGDPYAEELSAMQETMRRKSEQVEEYIDELRQVGVEFKPEKQHCHVCFPAMVDGKLAYLSWQPGEPEVAHWMELDGDFDERRPLLEAVIS